MQVECALAIGALCAAKEAHVTLTKQGGLASLVHLARSSHPELQSHVAAAFSALAEQQAPVTWLVQRMEAITDSLTHLLTHLLCYLYVQVTWLVTHLLSAEDGGYHLLTY